MARTALIAAIAVVVIVAAVILATRMLPQYGGGMEETPAQETTPTATTPAAEETTPAEEAGMAREITIDATEYEFQPGSIEVSPGERLIITVKNTGRIFHTFTIDELNIDIPLNPGDEKTVEIVVPSDVDKITFYCKPHRGLGMVGEFIVGGASGGEETGEETTPRGGYDYGYPG